MQKTAALMLVAGTVVLSGCGGGGPGPLANGQPGGPDVRDIRLSAGTVPCCERIEVTFALTAEFANAFDPREIQVDGVFRSPKGKDVIMPAFLYQDCERSLVEGQEQVKAVGVPSWKVRFSPTVPGAWQIRIKARDKTGESMTRPLTFTATPSQAHGYIRRAAGTNYFRYDDGTPFFPIGENLAWTNKRGTYNFDDWLPAAGQAGMNFARIWLQWNEYLSIEHKGTGAGRYDLANAWRMDHVLDTARQNGIRVLFTCDSPEPYQKEHYWLGKLTAKPWENCPHNAVNGGPMKDPAEFYTTEEGHRLIRQRLRYIVARWGWDPNIFCWELWNELSCFPGWEKLVPEIAKWHVEMAGVLRELDPNRHLVTTSFSNTYGHEDIWKLPELDFVQSHSYGVLRMGRDLPRYSRNMMQRYGRPHLFGEFGPPLRAEYMDLRQLDPDGVHLHNAIWSTALCGTAGTALSWWWDNYVHPNNLYRLYTPLARFCRDVPWTTADFKPAQASLSCIVPPEPAPPQDLTLECKDGPQVVGTLVIDSADPPDGLGRFYLYGRAQKDQQNPITIELNRAEPGPLVLRIGRVWIHGILNIKLDGTQLLCQEFPAGEGKGPWVHSEFNQEWKIWGADYDKDVVVDIPAGKHQVELYNAGADGITIDRLTLPRYAAYPEPKINGVGLVGKHLALLWLQNRDYDIKAIVEKREAVPIAGARVMLQGIPAGACTVEWWDTATGVASPPVRMQATDTGLPIDLPVLSSSVACKVRW